MTHLIYGTTNPAKLHLMRETLKGLPLTITGLGELEHLPDVKIDEAGSDPLENATIKARTYFQALHEPVFSCDTGLYFEGLPDELQPGVHVRRVHGRTLSDDEMMAYYAGLARQYGMLKARYCNAICVVLADGREVKSSDESLSSEWFGLVETPCTGLQEGFPLDPLSVRLSDGRYYLEAENEVNDTAHACGGFRGFFEGLLAAKC